MSDLKIANIDTLLSFSDSKISSDGYKRLLLKNNIDPNSILDIGDYVLVDRFLYYYKGYPLKIEYNHSYLNQIKFIRISKMILDEFLSTGSFSSKLYYIFPENQYTNIINKKFFSWNKTEKVFDFVIDTFKKSNYDSTQIDLFILKESFNNSNKYNKEKSIQYIKDNYNVVNNKVKIYRGVQSISSPLEKSLSWTLDKDNALFFTKRFKSEINYLYETLVDLNDIIGFFESEKEIFVEYKKLNDEIIKTKI
ncbi:hypothetical protein [Clostridium thermobutyricum]|uniref:hypothetical protein n=1 Tax=Clostridium thermobutyricum TaxID=29372 RepID=UPI0018A97D64|nr:hypothetical protein [Clostridium thermobutyricum]